MAKDIFNNKITTETREAMIDLFSDRCKYWERIMGDCPEAIQAADADVKIQFGHCIRDMFAK